MISRRSSHKIAKSQRKPEPNPTITTPEKKMRRPNPRKPQPAPQPVPQPQPTVPEPTKNQPHDPKDDGQLLRCGKKQYRLVLDDIAYEKFVRACYEHKLPPGLALSEMMNAYADGDITIDGIPRQRIRSWIIVKSWVFEDEVGMCPICDHYLGEPIERQTSVSDEPIEIPLMARKLIFDMLCEYRQGRSGTTVDIEEFCSVYGFKYDLVVEYVKHYGLPDVSEDVVKEAKRKILKKEASVPKKKKKSPSRNKTLFE
ncbi:MAG: hypothetical protein WC525_10020 [Candidatus Thermoplasmatota archaeon]